MLTPLANIQKQSDESIEARLNQLRASNDFRFDFVLELAQSRSISEALRKLKIGKYQYYIFTTEERKALEQLAVELRRSNAIQAQLMLYQVAAEAVEVKVRGLRSKSERVSQAAASDILDRTVGQAKQSGGSVGVVLNVNWDMDGVLWGDRQPGRAVQVVEVQAADPEDDQVIDQEDQAGDE